MPFHVVQPNFLDSQNVYYIWIWTPLTVQRNLRARRFWTGGGCRLWEGFNCQTGHLPEPRAASGRPLIPWKARVSTLPFLEPFWSLSETILFLSPYICVAGFSGHCAQRVLFYYCYYMQCLQPCFVIRALKINSRKRFITCHHMCLM